MSYRWDRGTPLPMSESETMSKAEVAAYLDVSERAIIRYAERGRLHPEYIKRPGGGQEARYQREEVERLKAEMAQPQPRREAALTRRDDAPRQADLFTGLVEALKDDGDGHETRPSELAHKLTLTIAEASILSGLSTSTLERAIAGKVIEARDVGPRGSRVMRRIDLERIGRAHV